jgi:hypothetical protein
MVILKGLPSMNPAYGRDAYCQHLNSNMFDGYKDLLFSLIKTCVDSYISFERFVQCRFSNSSLHIFYCSKGASMFHLKN